jgi:hypothetical protein
VHPGQQDLRQCVSENIISQQHAEEYGVRVPKDMTFGNTFGFPSVQARRKLVDNSNTSRAKNYKEFILHCYSNALTMIIRRGCIT